MKKQVDKSKITIVIMSIVFALSLSVTITLAAFSANKTGDVTLTFADGLTMSLAPKQSGSGTFYYEITSADESSTTFTYPQWQMPSVTVANRLTTADGVVATLNKAGYVSWRIDVKEVISNVAGAISGAWRKINDSLYYFEPTGTLTDWRIELGVVDYSYYTITFSGSTITGTGSTLWTTDSLTHTIFTWLKIAGVSSRYYFNDLGGRTFTFDFIIKAKTDSAPTF